jgi:hypothetical protein
VVLVELGTMNGGTIAIRTHALLADIKVVASLALVADSFGGLVAMVADDARMDDLGYRSAGNVEGPRDVPDRRQGSSGCKGSG